MQADLVSSVDDVASDPCVLLKLAGENEERGLRAGGVERV
jgi:hypothetical protein